ncbi:MAG: S8 family peptidase [Parvibaculales bacterium]
MFYFFRRVLIQFFPSLLNSFSAPNWVRVGQFIKYCLPGLILALAACGGGGGSTPKSGGGTPAPKTGAPPQPTPAPAPPKPKTPKVANLDIQQFLSHGEFQGQIGLAMTKAAHAYARGLTGEDIRIGFTDTGLDTAHSEFSDKRIYLKNHQAYGALTPSATQLSHGTSVASIAAGRRGSGAGMHGVAYNADIGMYALALTNDGNLTINDDILNTGLTQLANQKTQIYNHSWGMNIQFDPSLAGTQRRLMQLEYGQSVQTMVSNRGIHVWSAGNEGGEQVSATSGLPFYFDELRGRVLVAVAVDDKGHIGSDSNRCGAAKAFCLAAPGGMTPNSDKFVKAAKAHDGYHFVVGTSFAAPHVTAALALMKELFGDQLSDKELVARLLKKATKTGVYADSDIYGQGLLNIEAATNPVGPAHILAGNHKISIDDSGFNFTHIDDDLLQQLRRRKIIIHDSLNAPFSVPLAVFDQSTKQSHQLAVTKTKPKAKAPLAHYNLSDFSSGRVSQSYVQTWAQAQPAAFVSLTAPLIQTGGHQSPYLPTMASPYLSFTGEGFVGQLHHNELALTAFLTQSDMPAETDYQFGVTAQLNQIADGFSWSVQAGAMFEENAWLGNRGNGVFSTQGFGQNLFLGFGGVMTMGRGWSSGLGVYVGQTQHHRTENSFTGAQLDDVTGFAFEYMMWRPVGRGHVYTRLAQPLRYEAGQISLRLPVRRLAGGGQIYENMRFDLSPTARQIEWGGGYVYETSQSAFSLNLTAIHHHLHSRANGLDYSLLADMSWRF